MNLTESELAERWKISIATLRRMRKEGRAPSWFRAGFLVRYPLDAVQKFEAHRDRG